MKVVGEHLHQCCARFFKPQLQSRSKEKAPPSHPRTTKAFTSPRFLLAGKGILTAGSGLGVLQRQKGVCCGSLHFERSLRAGRHSGGINMALMWLNSGVALSS